MFANVSRVEGLATASKKYREEEKSSDTYKDPLPDNSNCINAAITLHEVKDCINSLSTKKTYVGIDAISNDMLKHLPEKLIGA